jgi:hypothetical protein
MSKIFVAFGAALLCLFLEQAVGNGQSSNYFNWDVESDTYTTCCNGSHTVGYFNGYLSGSTSSRSTDTAHRGSSSMKLTVIGNDRGNQPMGADVGSWNRLPFNVTGSPAIYYRWWMKIMPGFSWGSGTAKTKSSRVIGSSVARVYTGYVQKTGFNLGECDGNGCIDPGPSIGYDMSNKADGQWHEYIVMVKVNSTPSSSDGQFRAYVDTVQVGQTVNFALNNSSNNPFNEAWGGWMVSPYFQLNGTGSDGGTIYLDDFSSDSVWNSLLSGAGQPTPPVQVVPRPPTSLHIFSLLLN